MNSNPTDTSTPAEEMCAAASKLRKAAGHATPGPWGTTPQDGVIAWQIGPGGFDDDYEYVLDDNLLERNEDASWIAIVHPGMAEPLANWLEASAAHAAKVSDPRNQEIIADQHALKVARIVNGTAE